MKVVLIDPRRTVTADIADLHLPIKPDGDVPLFLGLLRIWRAAAPSSTATSLRTRRASTTRCDPPRCSTWTISSGVRASAPRRSKNFSRCSPRPRRPSRSTARASTSRRPAPTRSTPSSTAISRRGASAGPGMGPFSVTGQPNAMGGREVGGLANMLAAHMDIENAAHRDRVQRFWHSPTIAAKPGLKAVDMFRAVADGRIKALWIMATNPVVRCRRPRTSSGHPRLPVRRRLGRDGRHRHGPPRPCAPAGRRMGREGRHRHQFGAAHLAPANLPAGAGRCPPRLVDRLRGCRPHGLAAAFAYAGPRRFLPSTPRCRLRERRRARFRHRRVG